MSFPYKKVLIIGATSGIGLALAEKILSNGTHIIAVGRRKERLSSLSQKNGSEKVSTFQFDITNLEGIPSFAASVVRAHPDLDSLLFSSGIQRPLDFSFPQKIDLDMVSTELTTNYHSYIHLLTAFLPHFLSSPANQDPIPNPLPKSLIFISSALGLVPIPTVTNYCASKAALHQLVLCIREQLRWQGVKVIEVVAPAVKTELHDYQEGGAGGKGVGMDLDLFVGEVWEGLLRGDTDVRVGMAERCWEVFEERRAGMFRGLCEMMNEKNDGE